MKKIKFNTEEEWLEYRKGKITGTKAGSLISKRDKNYLKGFYEIIAERVAIPHNGENYLDRGHRLEKIALDRFEKETGKKVDKDLVICYRDDFEDIAYSPDGIINNTEDVEVKCLSSALHIQAFLTKEIPKEYVDQIIQGFVVNDKLKKRYLVFFDPRMPKDFFYLEINRSEFKEEIKQFLEMEKEVLQKISEIESSLTF
jgi:predicted phage-related endonuclease